MTAPCCDRFRGDLSAFADGTLPSKRWEQVSYHLAGCQSCREEVAAISSVCSTLSACRRSTAPMSLAARLESIAGEQASAPLYMAAGSGELPSARRQRQKLMAQSSVALLAAMVSVVVLAVLIAPEPIRISDPIKRAREQYSMSSSAISVNEAVGAVLLAFERGAELGAEVSYRRRATATPSVNIQQTRVASLLQRASSLDLTLSGVQRVWVSNGEGKFRSAAVSTKKVQGQGSQLAVLDARGDQFSTTFLPTLNVGQVDAPDSWRFVEGKDREIINERSAVYLRAFSDDSEVASWWVDADTGLLLWSERYNPEGEVTLAVGYESLTLGEASLGTADDSPLISLKSVADTGDDESWCVGLAICPDQVAGLPLSAYSSSNREGSRSMNLVYSDGFETAVVAWAEGILPDDVTSQTDQQSGLPSVELWQAGAGVMSITSNAPRNTIEQIAEQFPAAHSYPNSLLDRAKLGFARLMPIG